MVRAPRALSKGIGALALPNLEDEVGQIEGRLWAGSNLPAPSTGMSHQLNLHTPALDKGGEHRTDRADRGERRQRIVAESHSGPRLMYGTSQTDCPTSQLFPVAPAGPRRPAGGGGRAWARTAPRSRKLPRACRSRFTTGSARKGGKDRDRRRCSRSSNSCDDTDRHFERAALLRCAFWASVRMYCRMSASC